VEWLSGIKQGSDKILAELDAAKDGSEKITVDRCPVRYIRQVKEDGTDILLGDVEIGRSNRGELFGQNRAGQLNHDGKEAFDERNLSLPAGHPDIVWMPGCEYTARKPRKADFFQIGSHLAITEKGSCRMH